MKHNSEIVFLPQNDDKLQYEMHHSREEILKSLLFETYPLFSANFGPFTPKPVLENTLRHWFVDRNKQKKRACLLRECLKTVSFKLITFSFTCMIAWSLPFGQQIHHNILFEESVASLRSEYYWRITHSCRTLITLLSGIYYLLLEFKM